MRRSFGFVVLVVVLSLGFAAAALAEGVSVPLSLAWTDKNAEKLNTLVTADVARELVREAMKASPSMGDWDLDANPADVSEFGFFDLNGDGHLELLGVLDYSGRGIAFYLAVVTRIGTGLHAYVLDTTDPVVSHGKGGAQIGLLKRSLFDIGGNGHLSLIVGRRLRVGRSEASPAPYFDDIYDYQQGKFVLSDSKYPNHYRKDIEWQAAQVAEEKAVLADLKKAKRGMTVWARRQEVQDADERLRAFEESLIAEQKFLATGVLP